MTTAPATAEVSTRPVPLWRRCAAILYDTLALIGIWFVVAGIAVGLHRGEAIPDYQLGFQLALLGAAYGYFGLCWRRGGQTLGMKSWRIRVVDAATAAPLSWHQITLRFGVGALSWVPLAVAAWAFHYTSAPRALVLLAAALLALAYWWALGGRGAALIDRASHAKLVFRI
jgi:uncharacterized RDD family membrane protein YckC